MSGRRLWTAEEDAIIRGRYWRRGGVAACARMLDRSYVAIKLRAKHLGVRAAKQAIPWTSREDQILALEWGELQPRTLRSKLPGRTWIAIVHRATLLGLGSPAQGRVSVAEASRMCGYARQTMRAILLAEGVTLHSHPGGMTAQRRILRRELVDADEAREAVERYLAREATDPRETLAEAGERHGLSARQMEDRLGAAGLLPARGRGRIRRVDPKAADRAVALWAERGRRPATVRCGRRSAEERAA